jgi:uncharacterized protein (DUF1800 family)
MIEWNRLSRRKFMKLTAAAGAVSLVPPVLRVAASALPVPAPSAIPLPDELFIFNRMGFGPREGDREAFRALAKTPRLRFEKYVDGQLHPESIADGIYERRILEMKFETLGKPLGKLWTDHMVAANMLREQFKAAKTVQTPKEMKQDENQLRQQPVRETEAATWLAAVYSKRQLHELLADFWHNHFNVYGWDNNIAPVFVHYDRDVIRPHIFGNFREMLDATGKSPAMLTYLDNALNQSGNPNENYARELFELHTLGAENYLGTKDRERVPGYHTGGPVGYVDGDVYEAARCFTGWRFENGKNKAPDTGAFQYFDGWHDRFQKIVLGTRLKEYQSPMKDANDVYDLLANHRGTARAVSRKLCRRLISDDPSSRTVERIAEVFHDERKSKDQLRKVVRAILLTDEFKASRRQKLKRPFEAVASMIRATGAEFTPNEGFQREFARGGQRLFQCRTPDGYPDNHLQWGGASSVLERWRMANLIASGTLDGVKIDLTKTPEALRNGDPKAFSLAVNAWIFGRPENDAVAREIAHYLESGPGKGEDRRRSAVALALMSPDFQWR